MRWEGEGSSPGTEGFYFHPITAFSSPAAATPLDRLCLNYTQDHLAPITSKLKILSNHTSPRHCGPESVTSPYSGLQMQRQKGAGGSSPYP